MLKKSARLHDTVDVAVVSTCDLANGEATFVILVISAQLTTSRVRVLVLYADTAVVVVFESVARIRNGKLVDAVMVLSVVVTVPAAASKMNGQLAE